MGGGGGGNVFGNPLAKAAMAGMAAIAAKKNDRVVDKQIKKPIRERSSPSSQRSLR